MLTEDLSNWEDLDYEQKGTKYRTLRDAMIYRGCGGFGVVDGDELMSDREIGFKPGEGSAGYANGRLEAGDEDGVVDRVKCGG